MEHNLKLILNHNDLRNFDLNQMAKFIY